MHCKNMSQHPDVHLPFLMERASSNQSLRLFTRMKFCSGLLLGKHWRTFFKTRPVYSIETDFAFTSEEYKYAVFLFFAAQ